jgi:hypothetical protein
MPCLIAIIAMFFPRLMLIIIALFTNWLSAAFSTFLWPILGFIFMPYTTLAYIAAMLNNHHSVSGGWLVVVIVAVLLDLGTHGGSTRRWRGSRTSE